MRRVVLVLLLVAVLALAGWAALSGWNPVPPQPATTSGVIDPGGQDAPDDSVSGDDPGSGDDSGSGIPAGATPAVVEYVHDGDTLFLEDGRKVRLLGINTPEIGDAEECWGPHAASELRGLLPEGQTVWVLEDVEPLDQYGRSLLFLFLPDGTNVNVEMVRVGAAEIEQYSPNWLYTDELHAAEDAAYADRVGLWGQC
jgi:micrococcal nuclease